MLLSLWFLSKNRHWLAQTSPKTLQFLLLVIQTDCKKTEVSYFVLELSRKNAFKPLFFEQKSSLACPNFAKNNLVLTFSHTSRLQKTRGLCLTLFLSYQGKMLLSPWVLSKNRHWLAQTSPKTIQLLLLAIQIDCKKPEVFILLCS